MLLDYKKEVYDIFEIIVDKKEYLDEFYFLHKLGYLNINKADILQDGKAFGTYQDFDTRIDLVTDKDSVLYHELIHFVDFSFNNKQSTTLYTCDNKVTLKKIMISDEEIVKFANIVISEKNILNIMFTSELVIKPVIESILYDNKIIFKGKLNYNYNFFVSKNYNIKVNFIQEKNKNPWESFFNTKK